MRYKIGDVVEGVVTGIKPYGAFVYIDSCHTGLIHISEISDYFVKDVHTFIKVNEKVKVKILDKADDGYHYKLSLKALKINKARILFNLFIKSLLIESLTYKNFLKIRNKWKKY